MKHLPELLAVVAEKIQPPVLVVLGSPWPATQIAAGVAVPGTVCYQQDVFQADRLREKLVENNLSAEVVTAPDLWDLPANFGTAIFPAAAHADRDLKLDMIEQGFHVLRDGGMFITLSEYHKDTQIAKWQKKVFGKCGESPKAKIGMAFWSTRTGDTPRRRHEITFHARIGDAPSMSFASWPGTFSYGRMDGGSRAMLEVADIRPGDRVLDMGCGNGAVGCLASQRSGPTGSVTFVDSNARAVALARKNAEENAVSNAHFVTSATLGGLEPHSFDVILANPPYYAKSEVARLFVSSGSELLKRGGRFYFVTRMPVETLPEVVDTFGQVESIENRGYTVVIARA